MGAGQVLRFGFVIMWLRVRVREAVRSTVAIHRVWICMRIKGLVTMVVMNSSVAIREHMIGVWMLQCLVYNS